jgi:macrodomain Ter protein organizer (MatP/YcbG family)
MAMTNAERQRRYRQKHLKDETGGKERLSLMLDFRAKLTLDRLAKRYTVTQAELIERLLREEQDRLLETLNAEEQTAYYDAVRR